MLLKAAFHWFVITVVGFMLRSDQLGVTSIVRDLTLHPRHYESLIHFFRSSAWSLESQRVTWLHVQQLHLSITPLRKGTVHTFVNQALVERFEGIEIAVFHEIKPVPYYTAALYQSHR